MKNRRCFAWIFVLLFTASCAPLTRNIDIVERDEFLNKFPLLNHKILGELKYANPSLDLRTITIQNYSDLLANVQLTQDYKRVVKFVEEQSGEQKLVMKENTFIICLRAEEYELVLCDDAFTRYPPSPDRVRVGKPVPSVEEIYKELVGNANPH